jgi:hypothetical protein
MEAMSAASAILELARQVRTGTRHLLAAAEPAWLTWAPPGTSNHLLWHAGHAAWLMDVLGVSLLAGASELPPGWADAFGMRCTPVAQRKTWPPRDAVDALLARQLERFAALLAATDDAKLLRPAGGDTLASRIIHGLHDEARHQGEMYLLLKLCRAGSP